MRVACARKGRAGRVVRHALLAATLLTPSLHAAVAHAEPTAPADAREESRAAFRRGVALLQKGDFPAARAEFEEAYRLFPHPSILLDLGTTRARTGEYVQAEADLVKFLADDGGAPPDEVQGARETLAMVRSHLGTFSLRVAPSGARATLDGAQSLALVVDSPTPVRASTGHHTLRVEASGYVSRALDLDVTSEPRDVEVALSPVPVARDTGKTQRTAGWIVAGGAVALAGLGVASGVYAMSLADAYNTRGTPDFQSASVRSTGVTFRTLADVSFAAALVGAGVGLALVWTAPRASVSASASGVWLSARF